MLLPLKLFPRRSFLDGCLWIFIIRCYRARLGNERGNLFSESMTIGLNLFLSHYIILRPDSPLSGEE